MDAVVRPKVKNKANKRERCKKDKQADIRESKPIDREFKREGGRKNSL